MLILQMQVLWTATKQIYIIKLSSLYTYYSKEVRNYLQNHIRALHSYYAFLLKKVIQYIVFIYLYYYLLLIY